MPFVKSGFVIFDRIVDHHDDRQIHQSLKKEDHKADRIQKNHVFGQHISKPEKTCIADQQDDKADV